MESGTTINYDLCIFLNICLKHMVLLPAGTLSSGWGTSSAAVLPSAAGLRLIEIGFTLCSSLGIHRQRFYDLEEPSAAVFQDETTLLIYIDNNFNVIVCRKVQKSGPKSAVPKFLIPVALMNNLAGTMKRVKVFFEFFYLMYAFQFLRTYLCSLNRYEI